MKLLVVSQKGCNPCDMVKNFLDNAEVEYKTFNITDEDSVEIQGVKLTKDDLLVMSTPVTILLDEDTEEVARVAGYNISALNVLVNQL